MNKFPEKRSTAMSNLKAREHVVAILNTLRCTLANRGISRNSITGTGHEATLFGDLLDSVFDRMRVTAMWVGLIALIASIPILTIRCSVPLGSSLQISYLVRGLRSAASMLLIMTIFTTKTVWQCFRQIWSQLSYCDRFYELLDC